MNKKTVSILRNVLPGRFVWTVVLLLGVTSLCLTQPRLENYISRASAMAGNAKSVQPTFRIHTPRNDKPAGVSDSLPNLSLSYSAKFNSSLSLLSPVPADVTVTSLADSGSGSLREALTLVPSG